MSLHNFIVTTKGVKFSAHFVLHCPHPSSLSKNTKRRKFNMTANKTKKKETQRNKTLGALPGLTETVGRLRGRNTGGRIALLEMAVVSAGLRSSQRTNDGDPRH